LFFALWIHSMRHGARVLEDLLFDLRWQGKSADFVVSNQWRSRGYVRYVPSRVWRLRRLFSNVNIEDFDVVIDLGCGAGRVLRWFLQIGFRKELYGIELDPKLAALAKAAFAQYKNVKVIRGNMCEDLPTLESLDILLYAYNPLRREPMLLLKTHIEDSYAARCSVTVCYLDPSQVELFLTDPLWSVRILEDPHPSPLGMPVRHLAAIMELRRPGQKESD